MCHIISYQMEISILTKELCPPLDLILHHGTGHPPHPAHQCQQLPACQLWDDGVKLWTVANLLQELATGLMQLGGQDGCSSFVKLIILTIIS